MADINVKRDQDVKDRFNKEKMSDKARPTCRQCGRYTDMKGQPLCLGHSGGGSGGSGEEAGKDDAKSITGQPGEKSASASTSIPKGNEAPAGEHGTRASDSIILSPTGSKFNPDVISELLSSRIVGIVNDEKGMLTIKLHCNSKALSPEKRNEFTKFINAILNELDKFKIEKGISKDCYTIKKDKDGNISSLCISSLAPPLYDAFIQRLASKQLLPIQNIKQQHEKEKIVYKEGVNHFSPHPLSTRLTPPVKKTAVETEEDNKRRSIRPKSPLPKSPLDGKI